MICQYGCGKEATHQFKNGKWCCSKIPSMCSVLKKNLSKIKKGKPSHWAGIKRGPQTENHKKKIKEAKALIEFCQTSLAKVDNDVNDFLHNC